MKHSFTKCYAVNKTLQGVVTSTGKCSRKKHGILFEFKESLVKRTNCFIPNLKYPQIFTFSKFKEYSILYIPSIVYIVVNYITKTFIIHKSLNYILGIPISFMIAC